MATTTMTVRLPQEVKDRLDRLAGATARSRSWLAADAITEYVADQEWQLAEIEQGVRDADAGDFASPEEVTSFFAKWSGAG
ncbi:MAG: CopG family ribbon-helix-helix protein [Acidobacteriota bacterium]|nr:CopG family ribbon-helix-helix protein [Acidobacteriota bacterium]MDH3522035.1 CopG family ribbon-helix-helix protein [Acidobacteriota bacterium]